MKVAPNEKVLVINSFETRVAQAVVSGIFPDVIEVINLDKDNAIQRFDRETGEALGGTWEEGAPRPRIVSEDDPIGERLHMEAQHRAFAPKVQQAAQAFSQNPTRTNHNDLVLLVQAWGRFASHNYIWK